MASIGKRLTIGRPIPIITNVSVYLLQPRSTPMAAAVMPEAPQNVTTATSPLIAAVGAAGAALDVHCASSTYSLFRPIHSLFRRKNSLLRTEQRFNRNTLELQDELTWALPKRGRKWPEMRKFPDIFPVGREFDATRMADGCGPIHPIRTCFAPPIPPQILDRKPPSRHKHVRSAGSSGPARFVAAPGGFVHAEFLQQPMTSRSKEAGPGPWA
jgi:hypothetical protein